MYAGLQMVFLKKGDLEKAGFRDGECGEILCAVSYFGNG